MTRLSAPQIAAYAKGAGFSGANLPIAVAVALAESGGRTDAVNNSNSNGSTDRGLWQINSVHAELLQTGNPFNPADNARMAYTIWKGSGWHAWTTYNSGAYMRDLAKAQTAAGAPDSSVTLAAAKTPKLAFPYKVKKMGANKTFQDATYNIFIQGRWYNHVTKNDSATYASVDSIPFSAMVVIARFVVAHGSNSTDDSSLSDVGLAKAYIKNQTAAKETPSVLAKGHHPNERYDVLIAYLSIFDKSLTTDNVPLPNLSGAIDGDWAKALVNFLKFISDPDNWLRVAEFILGAILILVAAYKIANVSIPNPVGKVVS